MENRNKWLKHLENVLLLANDSAHHTLPQEALFFPPHKQLPVAKILRRMKNACNVHHGQLSVTICI
jgi:hypothetical protein